MEFIVGAIISVLSLVTGIFIAIWQSRFQAKEVQRRDRQIFLTETLRQLAEYYGDARKFLYFEDATAASSDLVSEFAKTLGAITGLARSINDEEINKLINVIWKKRENNKHRAEVQEALEAIISRIGVLIVNTSGENAKQSDERR